MYIPRATANFRTSHISTMGLYSGIAFLSAFQYALVPTCAVSIIVCGSKSVSSKSNITADPFGDLAMSFIAISLDEDMKLGLESFDSYVININPHAKAAAGSKNDITICEEKKLRSPSMK